MSFTRAKPAGWATGEVLTSAQQNQLDADHANAVDGRSPGLEIVSRQVKRWMPSYGIPTVSTEWALNGVELKTAVSTAAHMIFTLDLPHGATLDTLELWLIGAAGHGALPASMPGILAVESDTQSPFGSNIITTQADTSANTGAFQGWHSITASSLAHVIDRTRYTYLLLLTTESGANAAAGLIVRGVFATFTTARIDEA